MNGYVIALFVHIVGALAFFTAQGLDWTSWQQIRKAASVAQVRTWLGIAAGSGRVGMVGMLALFASGVYMTMMGWGHVAWVVVSVGAIFLVSIPLSVLAERRIAAVRRAVKATDGSDAADAFQLARHPLIWIALQVRVGVALGIVFLMTVKPDLLGSLLTIVLGALLGLGFALVFPMRRQVSQQPVIVD